MKLISLVLLSVVFLLVAACGGESTTTSGDQAKANVLKLLNSKAPGEKSIVITHVSKEGVDCSKYANVKGTWKQYKKKTANKAERKNDKKKKEIDKENRKIEDQPKITENSS